MKLKNSNLFILLALLCFSVETNAGAIKEANQQLRSIFSNLHKPSPTVRIFYDMAAHRVDSRFYNTLCKDTTSCDTWYYLYEEVYYSAYDPITFTTPSDVLNYANSREIDTISLGMIDLQYAYLLPGVLNSGDYFRFDLDSNMLYDLDEYSFTKGPYGQGEVFMTAPLLRSSETLFPIFEIGNTTIFWDARTRMEDTELLRCRIDFGDGLGWHYINPLNQTYLSAQYPSKGTYYITTEFVDSLDSVVKHSVSRIHIRGTKVYEDVKHEELTDAPAGLKVYEIKPNCTYNDDEKYIFVLAGYNPKSFYKHGIRTFDQLYEKYIDKGNHAILSEYGYTIVLVDWEDHNDYIQANAMRFVELLEQYKCKQKGDEEFVVIGQSMGCLIGRYALTWMESDNYVSHSDCKQGKRHNTRLFISNDGPHQGVNIPLSLQWLYGDVFADGSFMSDASDFLNVISLGDINFSTTLLKGNSVKQMLYYHYSTKQFGEYFAHQLHNDYLRDLDSIGNYPKYCKLVAQSNGSLEGYMQQQYFSTDEWAPGDFRYYNDNIIDARISNEIQILGLTLGLSAWVNLKSNPYGSGDLGEVGIGTIHPIIELYWFGIRISTIQHERSLASSATNVIPFCVVPGGNEYLDDDKLGDFHIPLNTKGCFENSASAGIPWLLHVSTELSFCTNGLGFCFVPTVSAFDFSYNSFNEMFTDYMHLNKTNLFSRTPFDVVIGQYANDTTKRYNNDHEKIINRHVHHNAKFTYDTYLDTVRIVNGIIGDENLWLNNMWKPWEASYSAEKMIYINIPEDFLFHEIGTSLVPDSVGAYIRDGSFATPVSNVYEFNSSDEPKIAYFDGIDIWNEGKVRDCSDGKEIDAPKREMSHTEESEINISADEHEMHISSQKTISAIEVYTLQGQLLQHQIVEQDNCNQLTISLPQHNVMLVIVRNIDGFVYSQKVVK